MKYKKFQSQLDKSVNFIKQYKNSVIEARYVCRTPDVISAYVSSHNGCTMGCKFCWLTATNQTNFNHTDNELYVEQLRVVLDHADQQQKSIENNKVRVNINFMARGEPLANKYVMNNYHILSKQLDETVKSYGFASTKINISTILPRTCYAGNVIDDNNNYPITTESNRLLSSFCDDRVTVKPHIYYSLYSLNKHFRDKWMPNALPWQTGLALLKEYQDESDIPVTIHFALIPNENDNLDDIRHMSKIIQNYDFQKLKFNIIQYNDPYCKTNDSEKINDAFEILNQVANDNDILTKKSRIVPRVGYDVMASCGMFMTDY